MGRRALAAFAHDVAMAAASFYLSFYLRVGPDISTYRGELLLAYGIAFAAAAAAVFLWTGLYRGIWRFASLPDLVALVKAASLVILVFFPLMFLATRGEALPRSLVAINWLLLIALLGGPRFAYRVFKDGNFQHILERTSRSAIPVLLIGTREESDLFIRSTRRDPDRLYRVVGLISDSALRVGRDIAGVPILGTIDMLREVVARLTDRDERPQRIV
ncbi:MAG: nucleoside-diphosphate sugar epimerase/dehydratase, partial [Stellaceae bacterium]